MASTDRFNRIATNNSRYSYATAYNANNKTLSGRAPRGAQVPVYIDNTLNGTATADESGNWSLVLSGTINPGQTVKTGNTTGNGVNQRNFTIPTAPALGALSLSAYAPFARVHTPIVGEYFAARITGGSGGVLTLGGAGSAGLSISQNYIISGYPTTTGPIDVIETLGTASNSPRTTSAIATTATSSAGGGVAPANFISASGRAGLNNASATSSTATYYHIRKGYVVRNVSDGLKVGFWNGYCVARTVGSNPGVTNITEEGTGNFIDWEASALFGVTDRSALNQSAADIVPYTFTKAASGDPEYLAKRAANGEMVPATPAELAALGCGLMGGGGEALPVGDPRVFRTPSDWWAAPDPISRPVTDGEFVMMQAVFTLGAGKVYPLANNSGVQSLGDIRGTTTAASSSRARAKDWTTGAGTVSFNVSMMDFSELKGVPRAGKKELGIVASSTGAAVLDGNGTSNIVGDLEGNRGIMARALALYGYSYVNASVPAAGWSSVVSGQHIDGFRRFRLRHSSAAIITYYNDRLATFSAIQALARAFNKRIKASLKGGTGKILDGTNTPNVETTGSGSTIMSTLGEQRDVATQGEKDFNAFLRAGVFDVAAGDPDACWDINKALFDAALVEGWQTDANKVLFPVNGQGQYLAVSLDGTHLSVGHGPTATALKAMNDLPTKVGFAP